MVKARSPGYPSISLSEAVEKITLIYKNDYQNKIPRVVVAQHAGYKSMNGRALSVLASLSKYGLLEGRGDENWVSDLALQIIAHPSKSSERREALAQAADMPELFQEISERFPAGASDAALKSYLMTRKFIPDAADTVSRCYRETKQFVIEEGGSYSTLSEANDDAESLRARDTQPIDIKTNVISGVARAAGYANARASGTVAIGYGNPIETLKLNEPKLSIEGHFLRIEAWVDAKGLKRLTKMLAVNAPLLESDDYEEGA